ncbi:MAG: hypothetical protein ACNYPD_00815 [Candidatus Halichondribacter symbioticus]
MAISVTSQFVLPDAPLLSALAISGLFALVRYSFAIDWGLFGVTIIRWLNSSARHAVFISTLFILLTFSITQIDDGDLSIYKN